MSGEPTGPAAVERAAALGPDSPVRVSVVIPTHARDEQLDEALDSVLAQTVTPFEVLVCDDCDAASTQRLVADWNRRTDGRVRYVNSATTGFRTAGASRNVGASVAQGELLAFLDDDDLWRPFHLERLIGRLGAAAKGVGLAISWTTADDPGWRFARMPEGLSAADAIGRNPGFVGSNFLIRRELFERVGGFDPALRVSNDQDLLVRLLDTGTTYSVVPEVTLLNRIHTGPQLTDKTERRVQGLLAYYHKHRQRMRLRDRLVIGTIVADTRRACAPSALARLSWTGATAAGRAALVVFPRSGAHK